MVHTNKHTKLRCVCRGNTVTVDRSILSDYELRIQTHPNSHVVNVVNVVPYEVLLFSDWKEDEILILCRSCWMAAVWVEAMHWCMWGDGTHCADVWPSSDQQAVWCCFFYCRELWYFLNKKSLKITFDFILLLYTGKPNNSTEAIVSGMHMYKWLSQ